MRWLWHVAFAIALFLLFCVSFGVPSKPLLSFNFAVLVLASAFSSIVPDLDHEKSKGSQLLFMVLSLGIVVIASSFALPDLSASAFAGFAIYSFAGIGLLFVILRVFRPRHRGITHSLLALAMFSLFVLLWSRDTGITTACLIGYASHLLADFQIKLV